MLHSSEGDGRALLPPKRFRAAEGVREAWAASTGPFSLTPKPRGTPAQRAGVVYERKVHAYLEEVFPFLYTASQWFRYRDHSGSLRWCQPDGILRLGNVVVIFEVKSRFTADGWFQLRRLYSSVVATAFQPRTLGCCLVTKNYDPAIPFPERHELVSDVERWVIRRQFAQVGVFPWKP
jgi:hypothetical protein